MRYSLTKSAIIVRMTLIHCNRLYQSWDIICIYCFYCKEFKWWNSACKAEMMRGEYNIKEVESFSEVDAQRRLWQMLQTS
jgi:hypothetical protein